MINFENSKQVNIDNKVVLNGQLTYELTDEEIKKIKSILDGMVNSRSQDTPPVVTKKSETSVSEKQGKYVHKKPYKPEYEVTKMTSTEGKQLFCIRRKNGWTRAEKALANNAIKALPEIITISVPFEKNGKTQAFKAWGFKLKKQAEAMLKALPTEFSVEELNAWGK